MDRYYVNTFEDFSGQTKHIICDRDSKKLDGTDRTLDNTLDHDLVRTTRQCAALNRNWNQHHLHTHSAIEVEQL
jgi:hypothetical protein